ncbi:AGAP3 family protein [Megaselia abdita]
MLAVKNFFLPERKAPDAPKFSRMPEAFLRSIRRRSLRVKRAKSLVVPEREKRKSDSFVNSQEWTISRSVPDLRLGIVGSLSSGKSALVHRYLTGAYMQEESPEGGRFKKEVFVDNQSYLLLIRDEGGPPQMQFAAWVDAVIFVFSLEDETSFNSVYDYYNKLCNYRNSAEIPIILVGTQDAISERNPRIIDEDRAKRLAHDLNKFNCTYFETCATYGLNVEKVFQDACQKIVHHRISSKIIPTRPVSAQNPQSTRLGVASYNHNNSNGYCNNSTTLPHRHHVLSASSNHIQMRMSGDANKWSSHQQHLMANENNNILKLVPPTNQNQQQQHIPQSQNLATLPLVPQQQQQNLLAPPKDSKCNNSGNEKTLITPTSTPTTTRKNRRRSNLFITSSKKGEDKLKNEEVGVGRSIPIKQGYLYKRSSKALNKEWKKKYVTLCNDGRITYHPSLHDYMNDVHGKEIPLQCITVKVPGQKPRGSKSIITNSILTSSIFSISNSNSSSSGGSLTVAANGVKAILNNGTTTGISESIGCLSLMKDTKKMIAANEKVQLTGFENLKNTDSLQQTQTSGDEGIAMSMSNSNSQTFVQSSDSKNTSNEMNTPNVKKRHKRMKSSGLNKNNHDIDESDGGFEFYIISLDSKQWHFEAANSEDRDEWVAAIEQEIFKSLQGIESTKVKTTHNESATINAIRRMIAGNTICADCEAPNPEWASLNLGVLVCIECSGIHRNLGSHISKVRSLDLDDWPASHLSVMLAIGNSLANSIWEANSLAMKNRTKPTPSTSREEKESWIRSKYEAKEFILPLCNTSSIGSQLIDTVRKCDIKNLVLLLANSKKEHVNSTISPRDLRTPLHFACATGNLVMSQLLIWVSFIKYSLIVLIKKFKFCLEILMF